MPYPSLPSNGKRMALDIDGSTISYYRQSDSSANAMTSDFGVAPTVFCDQSARAELQDGDWTPVPGVVYDQYNRNIFYITFPEPRNVVAIAAAIKNGALGPNWVAPNVIQASPDSTNGMDGTWETGTLPVPIENSTMGDGDWWRKRIYQVSFSQPVKAVRLKFNFTCGTGTAFVAGFHLYGNKATGSTPDDIIFLDDDQAGDPEFLSDLDFGDRPEATVTTHNIRVKNTSPTKQANNIQLSLVDEDFTFSVDGGATYLTSYTIATLAPGASSISIMIKDDVGMPQQVLGPRWGRLVATVGSWT